MLLQGQTGKKGSFICWLVPTLHFLRPFVDFLAMKLDKLRGPDFTMRCCSNSVYTLRVVRIGVLSSFVRPIGLVCLPTQWSLDKLQHEFVFCTIPCV